MFYEGEIILLKRIFTTGKLRLATEYGMPLQKIIKLT